MGTELLGEGQAPSIYVVLSGSASVASESGETRVPIGVSDALGVYETLAGTAAGRGARIETDSMALRIDHDDLFDLLGHRTELLRQLFGALISSHAQQVKASQTAAETSGVTAPAPD